MEEALRKLDLQFKSYLEKKARLEDGKRYFEQQNNGREVEHYEMQLFELEQSTEGVRYKKLRQEILSRNEGENE